MSLTSALFRVSVIEIPKVSERLGAESNHCGMTMIALVFKTLIIIMMMMMTMTMMTIVVMGKIKTIKIIRITQEDDRNITMKIFKNSKPGKIV